MTDYPWEEDGEFRVRRYPSHEAYLEHQAAKLSTIDLADHNVRFARVLTERLGRIERVVVARTALCLGARSGAECIAFAALGLFAVGIDVNPGERNPWVLHGDFHRTHFAPASVDLVYTNAIDHVLDLGRFLHEVLRVLRPDGTFVAELVNGSADHPPQASGEYECLAWETVGTPMAAIRGAGFDLVDTRPCDYPWVGVTTVWSA